MSGRVLSPTVAPGRIDLLPDWFRNRQRGRRVCANWLTAATMLAILLSGFSAASWLRVKRQQETRVQMATRAAPILAMRQRSQRWSRQNERRETWCSWAESARPDDSLLQTLAALAAVSHAEPAAVVIDSIEIRLPLENAVSGPAVPNDSSAARDDPSAAPAAAGGVTLAGRVKSPQFALRLAERLNEQQRIDAAQVEAVPSERAASLRLTATPVATRVVP